jgi:hypothetical protein
VLLLLLQVHQISVVNMSLGIYRSSLTEGLAGTLCEIVRRLEEAGMAVICAASECGLKVGQRFTCIRQPQVHMVHLLCRLVLRPNEAALILIMICASRAHS